MSFWEKFDEEQFLRQRRINLKDINKGYPDIFEAEWNKFLQSFDCSYFEGIDYKDLNGDGQPELFVSGPLVWRDGEEYIFQQTSLGLRMILFDPSNIENEIKNNKINGFPELVFKSNWSGGERTVTHYAYNGRAYLASKCFSEETMVRVNGEMIQVEKPRVSVTGCRRRDRIVD